MRDVVDLSVTQIRIYSPDVVPYRALKRGEPIAQIQREFSFSRTGFEAISDAILFQAGEFESDGEKFVLERLSIEPRRVLLQILGPSSAADEGIALLGKIVKDFDKAGSFDKEKAIVTSEETTCSATLDFGIETLFSKALLGLVKNDLLREAGLPGAKAFLKSMKFAVEIGYQVQDMRITASDIGLAPKLFSIEPRAGTGLEENRYFTGSPLRSEVHLQMLEELEKRLTKS